MTKLISLDNGNSYQHPENLSAEQQAEVVKYWDALTMYTDEDTREAVHDEMAPCSEMEFLIRYLEVAPSDLILG